MGRSRANTPTLWEEETAVLVEQALPDEVALVEIDIESEVEADPAEQFIEEAAPAAVSTPLWGRDLFGDEVRPRRSGAMAERFEWTPFTVFDARSGEWQYRKRAWLSYGIQSELGRGAGVWVESVTGGPDDRQRAMKEANRAFRPHAMDAMSTYKEPQRTARELSPGNGPRPAMDYRNGQRGDGRGRPLVGNTSSSVAAMQYSGGFGTKSGEPSAAGSSGTSIFDPVICELIYRWFCPAQGAILDPFAGGSVRGIVASKLSFAYTGIDLSAGQLAANSLQAAAICSNDRDVAPRWIEGDSREVQILAPGAYDLVFSCPPYGDLERYSDDPRDISAVPWADFVDGYRAIIAASLALLKNDRFACFVVGDVRDKGGRYRGLPELTVAAFEAAGAAKYNEVVLITAVGSLPIRAGRFFQATRKLGKTHQNILIFLKGDPERAAQACVGEDMA